MVSVLDPNGNRLLASSEGKRRKWGGSDGGLAATQRWERSGEATARWDKKEVGFDVTAEKNENKIRLLVRSRRGQSTEEGCRESVGEEVDGGWLLGCSWRGEEGWGVGGAI